MKRIEITDETVGCSADIQRILDGNRSGEAEIVFRPGRYFLDAGLRLGKGHRGMTLRGEGKARLIGGRSLRGWAVAEDCRIAPRARGRILACSLAENGIAGTGGMKSRGFDRPVVPSQPRLFFDGEPQRLIRYPKGEAFLTISGVAEPETDEWGNEVGRLEAGFHYDDERPGAWSHSEDIWVHGNWCWDWATSYERVARLDSGCKKIVNAPPYGLYSFKKGQRFYFLNILEELTEPGEYYIDRDKNMLYFMPPAGCEKGEVLLSLLEEPLLTVEDSDDITILGLQLEGTCGCGIRVEGSSGVTIDNCHIRNIGNHGVALQGGRGNRVLHSTIHDCGDCGVKAVGGDRLTLEAADFHICNNHMYRNTQLSRCYQVPILLAGVGMTVRNNLIHDCPHKAIMYWGNDMTIEDNEIYRVVMETGDAGAVYTGKNYTFRGNRVCHNYIHHLGGVGMGAMGIYNDDCVSGTVMEDNYFVEATRAVMLGGGRDFMVRNNVFIGCDPAIELDSRGVDGHPVWRYMMTEELRERFYHIRNVDTDNMDVPGGEDVSGISALYLSRYPELEKIDAYFRKGDEIPGSGVIRGNVFLPGDSGTNVRCATSGERGSYLFEENVFAAREDFRDASWEDWELRQDSGVFRKGYLGRSMAGIGLQRSLRMENPCNVCTAISVREQGNGLSVCLRVRNQESDRARGTILVAARGGENCTARQLTFDLGPSERKEYLIDLADIREGFILEASSPTPGVRPSICRVRAV